MPLCIPLRSIMDSESRRKYPEFGRQRVPFSGISASLRHLGRGSAGGRGKLGSDPSYEARMTPGGGGVILDVSGADIGSYVTANTGLM